MTTTYKIEDNVPLPPALNGHREHSLKGALTSMSVGQSVLVTDRTRQQVQGAASNTGRVIGGKFSVRAAENGYRVWRIK